MFILNGLTFWAWGCKSGSEWKLKLHFESYVFPDDFPGFELLLAVLVGRTVNGMLLNGFGKVGGGRLIYKFILVHPSSVFEGGRWDLYGNFYMSFVVIFYDFY